MNHTMQEFVARFRDQMLGIAMFGVFSDMTETNLGNRVKHMEACPKKVDVLLETMYRFLAASKPAEPPTVPVNRVAKPVAR